MSSVKYVTEQDFQEEVISANLPVLVDFTADWCQPCKMINPIVEQLASQWDGKVKVVKLDADQNPNIMMQSSSIQPFNYDPAPVEKRLGIYSVPVSSRTVLKENSGCTPVFRHYAI